MVKKIFLDNSRLDSQVRSGSMEFSAKFDNMQMETKCTFMKWTLYSWFIFAHICLRLKMMMHTACAPKNRAFHLLCAFNLKGCSRSNDHFTYANAGMCVCAINVKLFAIFHLIWYVEETWRGWERERKENHTISSLNSVDCHRFWHMYVESSRKKVYYNRAQKAMSKQKKKQSEIETSNDDVNDKPTMTQLLGYIHCRIQI